MQIIDQIELKEFNFGISRQKILSQCTDIYHQIIFYEYEEKKQNFLVIEDNKIIAAVPLLFNVNKNLKLKIGNFFNLSIPGPIIIEKRISDNKFKKIINLILDEINKRSNNFGIDSLSINFSDTIEKNVGSQKYFMLTDKICNDNYKNKSLLGSRINLKMKLEEIVKNFSKGHRSEIKRQINKNFSFLNFEKFKIEMDKFSSFFDNEINNKMLIYYLYKLYVQNKIYLVFDEKNLFSSAFCIAGNTVEYFCSTQSSESKHSLILSSIKFFKSMNDIQFLNLGIIGYLNNDNIKSEKKNNIAIFKKGFGGEKFEYTIYEKKF